MAVDWLERSPLSACLLAYWPVRAQPGGKGLSVEGHEPDLQSALAKFPGHSRQNMGVPGGGQRLEPRVRRPEVAVGEVLHQADFRIQGYWPGRGVLLGCLEQLVGERGDALQQAYSIGRCRRLTQIPPPPVLLGQTELLCHPGGLQPEVLS